MTSKNSTLRSLLLALLLGFLAMLIACWDLASNLDAQFSQGVMQLVYAQVINAPVAVGRIAVFVLAVTALYLMLGVLAWLLARLTGDAFPRFGARQPYLLVTLSFLLLWGVVGLANAARFPWSATGTWSRSINSLLPEGMPLWQMLLSNICAASIAMLLMRAIKVGRLLLALRVTAWSCLGLLAVGLLGSIPPSQSAHDASQSRRQPNVVFLGIDSLRPELVGSSEQLGILPSLAAFLADAHRYDDASTPLARTFPSWMTLLSGRLPTTTGIRENLMPRADIHITDTLPLRLRSSGYRTIFATDEVRFSNIDASYGFDRTITPRIGATDFLLGAFNDLPLTNLIANTRFGGWLFPETYANRAAAVTYDPASFVDRLRREVPDSGNQPTFVAMHLTLPHWPYRWRSDADRILSRTTEDRYAYLAALMAVDRQVAETLRVLDDKGYMENTLFVVFSDHGEALNLADDNLIYSRAAKTAAGRVPVWMSGHGTSVLSASQYHILLAFRAIGTPRIHVTPATRHDLPVSMEDVAPTVLDLIGIPFKAGSFDGYSLVDTLVHRASPRGDWPGAGRIRLTESAYSTPSLRTGNAHEGELLNEGADVFRINPASGWVEINKNSWRKILDARERAAIGSTKILAAVPAESAGQHKFLLVPRSGRELPVRIYGQPDAHSDPEGSELWLRLHAAYKGELGDPAYDAGRVSATP